MSEIASGTMIARPMYIVVTRAIAPMRMIVAFT
jgi:hypothetical protein